MKYLDYDDSSIIVASLECLQTLTKLMPLKFRDLFIGKDPPSHNKQQSK